MFDPEKFVVCRVGIYERGVYYLRFVEGHGESKFDRKLQARERKGHAGIFVVDEFYARNEHHLTGGRSG